MKLFLFLLYLAGLKFSNATDLTRLYANTFSVPSENEIPIKLRGLVAQNSLDPMQIIFQDKIIPGSELEEGEKIGTLKMTSVSGQALTNNIPSEISINSPCKAKIEEMYCSSNTIVVAENNNGVMAPKYILSFLCLQYPTGQVQTNKKTDSDGSLEIFITSKENSMVVDVPDSEYVHEGAVLLGIWNDNTVFLRFEATKEIHKVKTAYPKPQMIGQRFQGGSSLVIIEISAPSTPQNTIPENQTSYFSHVEPLRDNSISTLEQSEKDESNREASVSGFEVDQSIQQLDTSPAKLDESVENEHFESQDPLPTYIHTDKDELQEVSNSRIIPIHEKQPIETALDNSAITYAIMMRNQIKKSKLHNLNKNFDLVNQKAKWIVRAPCSGTITSKKLTRNIKKILQGTLYATIQCNSKGRGKGAFENKGKEMALIMPFSIKINKIKADLQETEQPGLYSAQVSKNQSIITGKLIKESKDIPPHLIYGKFQLVTAPCSGILRNTVEIGKSVRKKDTIFSVDCVEAGKDSIMYGVTTKPGLVTKMFKENQANVKEGEAISIVRNNWRILTSPCDGLLIYTDSPGIAKIGTNIAVVICNDNKSKRKNIQATKNFMILQNILPNPSFVTKKQPLIVLDSSKFNWDSTDDIDDSNTISKVYSPSNVKSNIKNPKLPSNIIIQNIVSPCKGYVFREQELKKGCQIDESIVFIKIKCDKKKSYSLSLKTNAIVLENNVYEKIGEEMVHNYEPESFQVSKGDIILQIMFIHNIKHHVIVSPCDGFGYTFNSPGNKVSKGKYFAAIQCKDEEKNKRTQKIKAVKDMNIVSSYISFKKKFFKGDPLFIMVESN
ncbi:Uncharacterized protein GY17_00000554 [Cryptosporidium hominis]|uniref:Uncharacterized protein n=2 Tax=Cryptosporidium hominis TaxID=237895 RepID=A0ABX5BGR9_CRYHO|nr:Uncharacterized protein GY17_00000554 [Cryptosporidium hominis]|eukprot:PPS97567.1 Uncharacterized protein GY17_00000554 [Cryptosporidium hominis]